MKDNINALDEIHKGACMGQDALKVVIEKAEDAKLKSELEREFDLYDDIAKKIEEMYPKYNEGEPHDTSAMNKAMTWSHIEMKTLTDETSSKLAELIVIGMNMGIIEGRRILNNKKLNKEVEEVVSDYVTMQEDSMEILKEYL